MTWQLWSVLPVWVASLAAAIVIGVLAAPEKRLTWVAIAFAGAVIATFAIQLGIQKKEGFVLRAMASIGVAMLVLALTTGVFALLP